MKQPNQPIAHFDESYEIVKQQDITRKSHYINEGEIPEGKYGDFEDEEKIHSTKWKVVNTAGRRTVETFNNPEKMKNYLTTKTTMNNEAVNANGGIGIYGFEADSTVNSAGSVVFRHPEYRLVIQAGLNQDASYGYEEVDEDNNHHITINAVVNDKGLVLKRTSYSYDHIPTVEEFYGCVKMFLEEYLVRNEVKE